MALAKGMATQLRARDRVWEDLRAHRGEGATGEGEVDDSDVDMGEGEDEDALF